MHRLLLSIAGCFVIALAARCTPAQLANVEAQAGDVATAIAPDLASGCQVADDLVGLVDPPAAGVFDLVCADVVAADRVVARFQAQGIAARRFVARGDGGWLHCVRVVTSPAVALAATPADGGTDAR